MIDAALQYARAGYRVLALRPFAKEPATAHGVLDASSDPEVIASWGELWRRANLGIACGFGFFVLDVDVRTNGIATLTEWVKTNGPLPKTPTQRTASGGQHILFNHPGIRLKGRAGQGVDVKGAGGYIVAAPSHLATGSYKWEVRLSTTPIAEAPQWVLDLVIRKEAPPPTPFAMAPSVAGTVSPVDRARRYLERADVAVSGQGGSRTTFLLAVKLTRGFCLDADAALALLSRWNVRCEPPWSEAELRHKIADAIRAGEMEPGALLNANRRIA